MNENKYYKFSKRINECINYILMVLSMGVRVKLILLCVQVLPVYPQALFKASIFLIWKGGKSNNLRVFGGD
jgi:hypothetical protein